MSQRPTGAEAEARVKMGHTVMIHVRAELEKRAKAAGHGRQRFFITFPMRYRKAKHPVFDQVDVDAVMGLRAEFKEEAIWWVKHWIGATGWADILTETEFNLNADAFPHGCPEMHEVPDARHWSHPQGGHIIVWHPQGFQADWKDGSMDAYGSNGKRKQTSATPEALEEGHGAWQEVFYDHTGQVLDRLEVARICTEAGVY